MALDLAHDMILTLACSPTAEDVVYRPRGQKQRTIKAEIDRNLPAIPGIAPTPQRATNSMLVAVANDSTDGIDVTELQTGFDVIEVALRHGGKDTVARAINKIFDQDAGALTLEVI